MCRGTVERSSPSSKTNTKNTPSNVTFMKKNNDNNNHKKESSSSSSYNKKKTNHRRNTNRKKSPPPPSSPTTTTTTMKYSSSLPPTNRYVAMDCEMVGIRDPNNGNNEISSPACVTMIDWDGRVIFHATIRQTEPVLDYRTHVSGITKEDLEQEDAISLETCRTIVLQHLHKNRILVGHALQNDLTALRITHPWWLIRDTAEYEPFMKKRRLVCRGGGGGSGDTSTTSTTTTRQQQQQHQLLLWPRKLKTLAWHELGLDIQQMGKPHNSWEDAYAALSLYRKVRTAWEREIVERTKHQMDMEYHRLRREQEVFFCYTTTTNHCQQAMMPFSPLVQEQQLFFAMQQQQHYFYVQQQQQQHFAQQQQQQQQREQYVQ